MQVTCCRLQVTGSLTLMLIRNLLMRTLLLLLFWRIFRQEIFGRMFNSRECSTITLVELFTYIGHTGMFLLILPSLLFIYIYIICCRISSYFTLSYTSIDILKINILSKPKKLGNLQNNQKSISNFI